MSPILVSIIIPCYNVEDYVAECLDSAINQTYRPIEIIAVDNNSTDKTLVILKDYELRHPDLITVLEEKKQGAPAARNKGMSEAKGDWLQFLDADDLLLKEKIERQVILINGRHIGNHTVQVIGSYYHQFVNGRTVKIPCAKSDNPIEDIAFSGLGQTSANLFNKDAVIRLGGWDETLNNAQDLDMEFKLLRTGISKALYDFNYGTIYRQRKFGQITSTNLETLHLNTIRVRHRHYMFFQKERQEIFFQNEALFKDMVYYPIYCLAIYNPKLANQLKVVYLGDDYIPSARPGFISRLHVLGVKTLGFLRCMQFRAFLKKGISSTAFENIYSKYRAKWRRTKSPNHVSSIK